MDSWSVICGAVFWTDGGEVSCYIYESCCWQQHTVKAAFLNGGLQRLSWNGVLGQESASCTENGMSWGIGGGPVCQLL